MKSNKYYLVLPILLTLLSSCVSYGPIKEADFKSILAKDINVDINDLLYTTKGRFTWHVVGVLQIGQASDIERRGIIILSKNNVHFAEWKENSYQEIWKVPYKAINAVDLKSFGLNRLIIVSHETDNKPMTGSMTALDDSMFEIDAQGNEKVCNTIAKLAKTTCTKDY